jgi:hypothetical protein
MQQALEAPNVSKRLITMIVGRRKLSTALGRPLHEGLMPEGVVFQSV